MFMIYCHAEFITCSSPIAC